jgi:hypothetical protein
VSWAAANRKSNPSVGQVKGVVPVAADERFALRRDVKRIAPNVTSLREMVGKERGLQHYRRSLRLRQQFLKIETSSPPFGRDRAEHQPRYRQNRHPTVKLDES